MKSVVLLLLALAFCAPLHANPALVGTWSVAIDGQPLVVTFDTGKTGKVNGKPMQWQTLMKMLFVQVQGEQAQTYSSEVKEGKPASPAATSPASSPSPRAPPRPTRRRRSRPRRQPPLLRRRPRESGDLI